MSKPTAAVGESVRHSHAKDTSMISRLQRSASQRCLERSREGWKVAGAEREGWMGGAHQPPPQAMPPFPSGHQSVPGEPTCGCAPSAWLHSAVPTSVSMGDNDGNRGQTQTKGSCDGGRAGGEAEWGEWLSGEKRSTPLE